MGCTCGGDAHDDDVDVVLAAAIGRVQDGTLTPAPRGRIHYYVPPGLDPAPDYRELRQAAVLAPLDDPFPVPDYPDASWFYDKPAWLTAALDDRGLPKLSVDDDGRVAGYFYQAGGCLVHMPDACPQPSPTRYAAFHQQDEVTADGATIEVGVIGNTRGHADPFAPISVAQAHYADPAAQLLVGRAYDDEHGGYFLGAMVPHTGAPMRRVTYGDVALVRRSALSGDWRPMPQSWWKLHGIQASAVRQCEGYDCLGPTFVNRPGQPLVRRYELHGQRAAMLGGLGGIQLEDGEPLMPGTKRTTTIVEEPAETAPVGPHQAAAASEARQAADGTPPPNAGGGAADQQTGAMSPEELTAAVTDLNDRLSTVETFLQQQTQQQAAAIVAAVRPLPEPNI